jgi:hypothetical protein
MLQRGLPPDAANAHSAAKHPWEIEIPLNGPVHTPLVVNWPPVIGSSAMP